MEGTFVTQVLHLTVCFSSELIIWHFVYKFWVKRNCHFSVKGKLMASGSFSREYLHLCYLKTCYILLKTEFWCTINRRYSVLPELTWISAKIPNSKTPEQTFIHPSSLSFYFLTGYPQHSDFSPGFSHTWNLWKTRLIKFTTWTSHCILKLASVLRKWTYRTLLKFYNGAF